jgi:hypothetical protein
MTTFIELFTQPIGILLLACMALTLFFAATTLSLSRKVKSIRADFGDMLTGTSGANLEAMLTQHLQDRKNLLEAHDTLTQRITILERKLAKSKRHLGLVRYDAFRDVGGQQSFSLALFDDNGDGAVLSSIIGREGARVFGKPILAGKADSNLTNEENQAIMTAANTPTQ